MPASKLAALQGARLAAGPAQASAVQVGLVQGGGSQGIGLGGFSVGVAGAWLCVLLPIAWGLYMTLSKIDGLF